MTNFPHWMRREGDRARFSALIVGIHQGQAVVALPDGNYAGLPIGEIEWIGGDEVELSVFSARRILRGIYG